MTTVAASISVGNAECRSPLSVSTIRLRTNGMGLYFSFSALYVSLPATVAHAHRPSRTLLFPRVLYPDFRSCIAFIRRQVSVTESPAYASVRRSTRRVVRPLAVGWSPTDGSPTDDNRPTGPIGTFGSGDFRARNGTAGVSANGVDSGRKSRTFIHDAETDDNAYDRRPAEGDVWIGRFACP